MQKNEHMLKATALRMPVEMHRELKLVSSTSGYTMNDLIVDAIRSYLADGTVLQKLLDDQMQRVQQEIEALTSTLNDLKSKSSDLLQPNT